MAPRSGVAIRRVHNETEPAVKMSAADVWKRLRKDDPKLDEHLDKSAAAIKAGKGVSLKELRSRR